MTGFLGCIVEAVAKGEIDEESAALAREAYDDAYASASETFGPVDADRIASDKAMAKMEAEAIEARRRRQMMIRTRRDVLENLAAFKGRRGYGGVAALGGGGNRPPKDGWVQGGEPPSQGPGSSGAAAARFLENLVENQPGQAGTPGASMAGRHRAIRGFADAKMASVIERFESKSGLNLTPRRAISENVIREAFGEDSGDLAARALAGAFSETAEWLRKSFNAAGGAIGKLDTWGMPQRWDPIRVREVGREGWVEAVMPRLDRAKMVDRMTGQPFTDARLKAVLGEVWTTIATGGASKRKPGEAMGRGALAGRRGEERFLIFKDAANWMEAQKAFGEGDVFQAMMGHIDDMAIDIAQMQVLGPNPEHQFEWLSRFALREAALEEAAGKAGAVKKAERQVLQAERMYDHFKGEASIPLRPGVARLGANVRSAMSGITLGSAVLSELPSAVSFGRMARSFSGLDRNGDMAELVRLLALPEERAIARRSGFIIEQATDSFVRGSHDSLRLLTVGDKAEQGINAFARRLPALTLRATLLTPLVAARKRSFRFEFMGKLHDVRGQTLAQLKASKDDGDRQLADWFAARGFSEQDWDIMRSAPTWEPRAGASFLRPVDVPNEDLALRLAEGIELETRFMTPETSLWTRAKLIGVDKPGTTGGETRRSWAMFRGFSMTASKLYAEELVLRGAAKGGGNAASGALWTAGLAAQFAVYLTIAGAISLQLRETAKGNDPKPMNTAKFWMAALMQGGGLGIVGDFLYSTEARNGKTAPIVAAGPVGQAASDGWDLTGGNIGEIAGAMIDEDMTFGEAVDDAKVGRDMAGVLRNYNPLSSWWWSRAGYNRLVADNMQRILDPDAEDAFQRQRRRLEREQGQDQWWPTGSNAPERAPDLANVAGAESP